MYEDRKSVSDSVGGKSGTVFWNMMGENICKEEKKNI